MFTRGCRKVAHAHFVDPLKARRAYGFSLIAVPVTPPNEIREITCDSPSGNSVLADHILTNRSPATDLLKAKPKLRGRMVMRLAEQRSARLRSVSARKTTQAIAVEDDRDHPLLRDAGRLAQRARRIFQKLERRHENRRIGRAVPERAGDARLPLPRVAKKIAAGPPSALRAPR